MNRPWDTRQYAKSAALQADAAGDLISALAIQPNEHVLDFGCGMGNLTLDLAEIACQGSVLGIDTSPSMIDQAKRNLQLRQLPNAKFLVGSIADLPANDQFDVVFSNSALHWVKDQHRFLQAIHRLLMSNGRVGFQFPILNANHPLIAESQKAIQSLGLASKYASWTFPWYVPESAACYADLLGDMAFCSVAVTQHESRFVFATASAAYGFFDAVRDGSISASVIAG